jgi:hypothetical protein
MFGKQHLPQFLVGNSEADRNGSATRDVSPVFDWFLKAVGALALGQHLQTLTLMQFPAQSDG